MFATTFRGAIQWRRHLVNAYEGKAGMVWFAGKTVWSMSERIETKRCIKELYKYSSFPFPFLWTRCFTPIPVNTGMGDRILVQLPVRETQRGHPSVGRRLMPGHWAVTLYKRSCSVAGKTAVSSFVNTCHRLTSISASARYTNPQLFCLLHFNSNCQLTDADIQHGPKLITEHGRWIVQVII